MARTRIALRLEAWPAPDRVAWQAALVVGDLLDPGGRAAAWVPTTRAGVCTGYGRWLGWLTLRAPLDLTQSAAAQATPEVLADYVEHMRARHAASSVVAYLSYLVMALQVIAPDTDIGWLQRCIARLKRRPTTAVRDKWPRLQSTEDLLAFGIELMEAAEAALVEEAGVAAPSGVNALPVALTWERATQFRDGLMTALLALRPLRRKNFCAIAIGRHLVRHGTGYQLRFAAAETKTRQPLELSFPTMLVEALERYLTYYRPWLCQQTANRDPRFAFRPAGLSLWVSKTGSALSPEIFYVGLCKRTAARFGQPVHPHLFRDCAATSIATSDPEHVRIILSVLQHSTLRTSERHYNHARGVQATGKMQDHVLTLRRAAEATQRRGRAPSQRSCRPPPKPKDKP